VVSNVTKQPPDLDLEAILAAAVQRLVRLGKPEAAAALASSSITKVRGFNDWTSIEVFIASPDDAYDALTHDDLYMHDLDVNDFGEEYTVWGTSRLARVFTQVLPARMSCRDVEVKIAAHPVDPNWRDAFRKDRAINDLMNVLERDSVVAHEPPRFASADSKPAAGLNDRDLVVAPASAGVEPRADEQVESDRLGYPTLEEIEAKRRELAAAGRPHGFDALGGKSTEAPFPGQRSTIRRRYLAARLAPPGSWIPGICDAAPRHPHLRPT
jgi:hypothetical protein